MNGFFGPLARGLSLSDDGRRLAFVRLDGATAIHSAAMAPEAGMAVGVVIPLHAVFTRCQRAGAALRREE